MTGNASTTVLELLDCNFRQWSEIAQEFHLKTVALSNLFPTQVTVGMREVEIKSRRWREMPNNKAANYLETHRIPIILGPDARH
jgi:hypothetical protein